MNYNKSKGCWPPNVGIIALEIYFPSNFVEQSELEQHDGVSSGKYTIGLGQTRMGFCSDVEDIHSLCLTVVQKLMRKTGVGYEQIGRLEVGTETIVDKSKSVKTVLMQLFEESGNSDVEGVDTTNACYGGTSALLNSVAWVESSAWDGRFALVIAGDIAVYATGNARPTGGAGAVAMLIGPNAALIIDRGVRASHMAHAYDFYKPDLSSEYPHVDGKLSVVCYTQALDKCYANYCKKAEEAFGKKQVSLDDFDGVIFHAPYCKLVQKSLARLMLSDFLRSASDLDEKYKGLEQYRNIKLEESYNDRPLELALIASSKEMFLQKTKPSLLMATEIGNMYTASLYSCLASYIYSKPVKNISGKRIAMFSYGSGMAATLFSISVSSDASPGSPLFLLHQSLSDLKERLDSRIKRSPKEFTNILKIRQDTHHLAPYVPEGRPDDLFPGTWYLVSIDEMHRRSYKSTQSSKHFPKLTMENGVNQTCQTECSKKLRSTDCEKTVLAGSIC